MGKPRKAKNKYLYHVNRKKMWKKAKRVPAIQCPQLKKAWDMRKTVMDNFADMGLSSNPNITIPIPKPRKALESKKLDEMEMDVPLPIPSEKGTKAHVADELEGEANLKPKDCGLCRKPTRMFCAYMLDKYGDDYKAMAKDPKNFYQETPKKIKKRILQFKSLPEVYNEYLEAKKKGGTAQEMETT